MGPKRMNVGILGLMTALQYQFPVTGGLPRGYGKPGNSTVVGGKCPLKIGKKVRKPRGE
jgi:hypothetical protein